MTTATSRRLIDEIVGDIRRRERGDAGRPTRTTDAVFDLDFEMLIKDEDDTGKAIMRRIMHELAER